MSTFITPEGITNATAQNTRLLQWRQIASLTIVYSTVYSATDRRIHQSSASLAFVSGIQRSPVNSPHKVPVTRKMFLFDDVIIAMHDESITWWHIQYSWFFVHVITPQKYGKVCNIGYTINTLRPRQMDAISQTMFSNAFSWMKICEFRLSFHWSLFPRVQITIFHHWFR